MHELKDFGTNLLTGKAINWECAYSNKITMNGIDYEINTFYSDVVKIISADDLFGLVRKDPKNWETTFFDEIVMPTLTLAQQERVVNSYCLYNGLHKTPKKINQIFSPVRYSEHITYHVNTMNPLTGEVLSALTMIHGSHASVSYLNSLGNAENYTVNLTTTLESIKEKAGNEIGIIIRYADIERV